jgi:hypothetical protein
MLYQGFHYSQTPEPEERFHLKFLHSITFFVIFLEAMVAEYFQDEDRQISLRENLQQFAQLIKEPK